MLTALLLVLSSQAAMGDARFGGKYLVILTENGSVDVPDSVVARLPAERDFARLSSSDFEKLKPCLTIAVAHAFTEKQAAVAYLRKLSATKVQAYVKQAGRYVVGDRARAAFCARRAAARQGVGDTRLVIDVGGDVLLQLGGQLDGVKVKASERVPHHFFGPLASDPSGHVKKGTKWRVVDAANGIQECSVSGFTALLREESRGYSLEDDSPVPPPKPGRVHSPTCGSVEPWARLTCPKPVAPGALAVPGGRPLEVLTAADQPALVARARRSFDAHPEVVSLVREGKAAATAEAPFSIEHQTHVFQGATGLVVVVRATLVTGTGADACGGPDFHQEPFLALHFPRPDAEPTQVHFARDERRLFAAPFDLAGDGTFGLLWSEDTGSHEASSRAWQLSVGGRSLGTTEVAWCGCGC